MNFAALSDVKFGDQEGMKYFLLENGLQHQLFRSNLLRQGVVPPSYPLIDVDFEQLDDWHLAHTNEHLFYAAHFGLSNPFAMLDVDWNNQDDFYTWLADHEFAHEEIAVELGLQ